MVALFTLNTCCMVINKNVHWWHIILNSAVFKSTMMHMMERMSYVFTCTKTIELLYIVVYIHFPLRLYLLSVISYSYHKKQEEYCIYVAKKKNIAYRSVSILVIVNITRFWINKPQNDFLCCRRRWMSDELHLNSDSITLGDLIWSFSENNENSPKSKRLVVNNSHWCNYGT